MFSERFEGSQVHGASRTQLSFASEVVPHGRLKADWSFIENDTLRSNIASELQKVQFDVLLVNKYNVYWAPEAMTMKHAIIACASVAEAVLEVALRMVQDDPCVLAIIETRERVFEEFYTLQLNEFTKPDGTRVVTGVQREVVKSRLDRNTKMDLLIRAAQAGGIIDEDVAKKLQHLRRFRNRVHIKTVEELEYTHYKNGVTNAMIDIVEEFRLVAKSWIEAKQNESLVAVLVQQVGTPVVFSPPAAE
jgi:hypothetical protein